MRSKLTDRALRLFGDVRSGEGVTVLLLAANLCCLLFAYYLLKTIREPLVLGVRGGGAEIKSYASACQAVLLVGVSVAFGALARRLPRMKLIAIVTLFFAFNLVLFYVLNLALPHHRLPLGIAFFIWVGCFSVMIVAQFWAFANDLYQKEAGERLFALIGAGSAVGAVAGAYAAKPLFLHLGAYALMLLAAAILVLCLGCTWLVHRRELRREGDGRARLARAKIGPQGGFQLLVRDRYLLLVGALSLIKNWVNTTGEYILDRRLLEAAHQRFGDGTEAVERFIGAFKSDYFTYVNAIVLVMQLLAVSRIIRYLGVRRALFVLPAVALASYGVMAFVPILTVIFVGKISENSLDYSLQKTVEQTLFLVTSREAKYKTKAIVDSFLVRSGDVLTAAVVWLGTRAGLDTPGFILVNVVLVLGWMGVVVGLARVHRARAKRPAPTPSLAAQPAPAPA